MLISMELLFLRGILALCMLVICRLLFRLEVKEVRDRVEIVVLVLVVGIVEEIAHLVQIQHQEEQIPIVTLVLTQMLIQIQILIQILIQVQVHQEVRVVLRQQLHHRPRKIQLQLHKTLQILSQTHTLK